MTFSFGVAEDRDYFIENLSVLVGSGLTVPEALHALSDEMRSKSMRRAIDGIREDVIDGMTLWRALERSKIFSENTISLVRIGEESGRLAENLKVLVLHQKNENEFQSRIRSAMLYPVFVLLLTLVIGTGISWYMLPKFAIIYSRLNIELPLLTKIFVTVGTYLGAHGAVAIPIFLISIFVLTYFVFFFPATRVFGQAILFALPGLGRLLREAELARFGFLLGTLVQSGFTVTKSVESLIYSTPLIRFRKFYARLAKSLEEGNSFQRSFANDRRTHDCLSRPVQQMIITAEKSGKLAEMLFSLHRNFETKSEIAAKNITVLLEPVLLFIVWLGVLAVALAVILPIYSLVGGLDLNSHAQ